MPKPSRDISNQRFGSLVALNRAEHTVRGRRVWVCQCDCGNIWVGPVSVLENKNTSSCGCQKMEKIAAALRGDPGATASKQAYSKYTHSAIARGYEFSISLDDFRHLTQGDCAYCGCAPAQIARSGTDTWVYNGLDRVDNTRGYVLDNLVPACFQCNKAKGTMGHDEFLAWVERVAAFVAGVSLRRRADA